MKKFLGSTLFASGVIAVVIGLGATSALATTWTVSPGGSITGTASSTTFSSNGNTITCTGSTAKGTLKSGSGLSGTGIGSITSISFSGCTGGGLNWTVTAENLPWSVNAVSYNSSTGVTTGTITGVSADLSGTGISNCSFDVDGSGADANNGSVTVTYSNSSNKLTVTTPQTLKTYNPSFGCFGLIRNGGSGTFSAMYAISPAQTITSP